MQRAISHSVEIPDFTVLPDAESYQHSESNQIFCFFFLLSFVFVRPTYLLKCIECRELSRWKTEEKKKNVNWNLFARIKRHNGIVWQTIQLDRKWFKFLFFWFIISKKGKNALRREILRTYKMQHKICVFFSYFKTRCEHILIVQYVNSKVELHRSAIVQINWIIIVVVDDVVIGLLHIFFDHLIFVAVTCFFRNN